MPRLSKVHLDKKTLRRGKHIIKKIILLLIPLSIAFGIISLIFLTKLVIFLRKPLFVSPLSTLGISAIRSQEDTQETELKQLLQEKKISYIKVLQGVDSSYIIQL